MQQTRFHRAFLSHLLLAAFSLSCLSRLVSGQSPTNGSVSTDSSEVTFHVRYLTRTDPIKINHLFLGDKEVSLDTPVHVEGMWMRNLKIVVENITTKPIARIGVTLNFPETGDGSASKPIQSIPLAQGRFPKHAFLQRDGTDRARPDLPQPPEISVQPGSSVTLATNETADVTQTSADKIAGRITKVDIEIPPIHFSDESKWMAGSFYRAVPPPEVWQKAPVAEFLAGAFIAQ